MATLIAKIDSLDPLWEDFYNKFEHNGSDNDIREYLEKNCQCEHVEVDEEEIIDETICRYDGWFICYRDIMCESVFLFIN